MHLYVYHIQSESATRAYVSQQAVARPDGLQYSADHYRSIYTCTSLFQTLYLPDPDVEHAPVGDELMEWLNTHFIEPSTEEGEILCRLKSPWEGDGFWDYLTRFVSSMTPNSTTGQANLVS